MKENKIKKRELRELELLRRQLAGGSISHRMHKAMKQQKEEGAEEGLGPAVDDPLFVFVPAKEKWMVDDEVG